LTTSPDFSEDEMANRLYDCVSFLFEEINRIYALSQEGRREEIRKSGLSSFIEPFGEIRQVLCGAKANQLISKTCHNFIEKSEWHNRIDPDRFKRALANTLSNVFVRDQSPNTKENVVSAFADALTNAANECECLKHFIPCHIVNSETPSKFNIGAIEFFQTKGVFDKLESEIELSTQQSVDSYIQLKTLRGKVDDEAKERSEHRAYVQTFADEAKEYFEKFDWLALIKIPESDSSLSKVRAENCVKLALNFLSLYFRYNSYENIVIHSHPLQPQKSSSLYQNEKNFLRFSSNRSWHSGVRVPPNWWEVVQRDEGEFIFREFGKIIDKQINYQTLTSLEVRLVDAITWYGEAFSDPAPGTRLLKLVAAIERLTNYNEGTGVTKRVCERVAILTSKDMVADYNDIKTRMRVIYECRSNLAHGRISPFDNAIANHTRSAETFVQDTIFQFMFAFSGSYLLRPIVTDLEMTEIYKKFGYQRIEYASKKSD
jgi:Apea-like HEPN